MVGNKTALSLFLCAMLALSACATAVTSTARMAGGVATGAAKTTAKASVSATGAAVDLATPDGKSEEAGEHHDDNPRPFDASRRAMEDVDVALAMGSITDKRVLLVLGGNWCHDSRGLAAHFERPELAATIARHYELVWVDVGRRNRNLDVPRRFGVYELHGTPTVLILSSEGALLNEETAHDWRRAHSISYEDTLDYFQRQAMR